MDVVPARGAIVCIATGFARFDDPAKGVEGGLRDRSNGKRVRGTQILPAFVGMHVAVFLSILGVTATMTRFVRTNRPPNELIFLTQSETNSEIIIVLETKLEWRNA